jgi:hypothetical protein
MKREQLLQKSLVDWFRWVLPPEWKVASIPNGGHSASARITNHSMGMLAGMPDFMILGPDARVWFVEVKCPLDYEGRPSVLSPAQRRIHAELRALGHTVVVLHSLEEADAFAASQGMPVRVVMSSKSPGSGG